MPGFAALPKRQRSFFLRAGCSRRWKTSVNYHILYLAPDFDKMQGQEKNPEKLEKKS